MGSVNKVILVGNIGRDPEYATSPKDQSDIARFSVATTSRGRDESTGEWVDKTDWHRVVLFGRQATSLKPYLKKGSLIGVDGKLRTRSWQDKDGQKRYTTEVIADRIELIGGRSGGTGSGGGRGRDDDFGGDDEGGPAESPSKNGPTDDDIPF